MMEDKKPTLRELKDGFFVKDTPENRMKIHRRSLIRQGEIASGFVKVLQSEGLTVRKAISILKDTENLIMQSQFGKTIED